MTAYVLIVGMQIIALYSTLPECTSKLRYWDDQAKCEVYRVRKD